MIGRRAALSLLAASVLACDSPDDAARQRVLASDAGRRLVGAWDLTLTADTMSIALRLRPAPRPIAGVVAFTPNRTGPSSTATMHGITHEGAYDLDVASFGFTIHDPGAPSVAVARVAPGRGGHDSLWIVLSPESPRFPLRLRGLLASDSAAGVWTADSHISGGGSGHFVMHRHAVNR